MPGVFFQAFQYYIVRFIGKNHPVIKKFQAKTWFIKSCNLQYAALWHVVDLDAVIVAVILAVLAVIVACGHCCSHCHGCCHSHVAVVVMVIVAVIVVAVVVALAAVIDMVVLHGCCGPCCKCVCGHCCSHCCSHPCSCCCVPAGALDDSKITCDVIIWLHKQLCWDCSCNPSPSNII